LKREAVQDVDVLKGKKDIENVQGREEVLMGMKTSICVGEEKEADGEHVHRKKKSAEGKEESCFVGGESRQEEGASDALLKLRERRSRLVQEEKEPSNERREEKDVLKRKKSLER